MITQKEFENCFDGYEIIDCAVRSPVAFHFVVRHINEGIKAGPMSEWTVGKRGVSFFLDEPEGQRVGGVNLNNFKITYVGACKTSGQSDQVVFVDSAGEVCSRGGGHNGMESPIPIGREGPMRGIVLRARMIDGNLFLAGSLRSACRRRGVNDWESLCYDLPVPTKREHEDVMNAENLWFSDIDAFNVEDLYVVGGKGIVWHLQGKSWTQIAFPSNMHLESVCCAEDGFVYIGAQSGTVFKGRGDKWKMIYRGNLALPFKDIVWHAGRLWCTNDYGLWVMDGENIVRVEDINSDIAICAGNLSVADGMLLMAGRNGAAYHDGDVWRLIFNDQKMKENIKS